MVLCIGDLRRRRALVALAVATVVALSLLLALQSVGSGSKATEATEELVVQPQLRNEVCILFSTNTTSTIYLEGGTQIENGSYRQTTTLSTTTQTIVLSSTATLYENITVGHCTEVNPHYNVSSSCPPCA